MANRIMILNSMSIVNLILVTQSSEKYCSGNVIITLFAYQVDKQQILRLRKVPPTKKFTLKICSPFPPETDFEKKKKGTKYVNVSLNNLYHLKLFFPKSVSK